MTLGADGGKVDGAVIDSAGNPNAGATVLLAPNASLRHRADLFLTTTRVQYGHFERSGVYRESTRFSPGTTWNPASGSIPMS
ncbi:MAG TPA: hypothetical protein VKB38_12830 [Terracidiphilus sp.]|nr:hypothetical protein [Terracidiphilus sp.]